MASNLNIETLSFRRKPWRKKGESLFLGVGAGQTGMRKGVQFPQTNLTKILSSSRGRRRVTCKPGRKPIDDKPVRQEEFRKKRVAVR